MENILRYAHGRHWLNPDCLPKLSARKLTRHTFRKEVLNRVVSYWRVRVKNIWLHYARLVGVINFMFITKISIKINKL